MSSRQLRKLRKQQDLLSLQAEGAREDEDSEDEPSPAKPRPSTFSAFAALGGDDGNDDDEDDEDDQSQNTPDVAPKPAVIAIATPPKKSKKSKKKKKGKKSEPNVAAEEPKQAISQDGLDEIDLALKELNVAPSSEPTSAEQQPQQSRAYSEELSRLLSVNTHHLKVVNEMRALFGRETIEAARVEDDAEAQQGRRRQRQVPQNVDLETFLRGRPGQKISEVLLRRNPFIQGKENWPKASAEGLTMEPVQGDRGDIEEYRFCHDKAYDNLEGKFFAYVQMHDPMQLVYFLYDNPYHVSTLIQVSKVAKQDQNNALSSDLCERALFTLGRVTLSSFRKSIEQGKARLNFRRPENRQFWLAGYNYIKNLLQKGTYRTALEWTKLFISLAPEDPYGFLNYTHVLAIRARQARWFIDLCKSEYFSEWDNPMAAYYRQTVVLAKLQLEDYAGAIADLVKGMQEMPWLYGAICSALGIDTPRAVWGVQPRTADEELYTELYLHTAKDLWSNAQATDFLKEAGSMAYKVNLDILPNATPVPLSITRFVYLDNTPSLMAKVPRKMLHATPNFDFDPLPPAKEDNVFSSDIQMLPWEAPGNLMFEGAPTRVQVRMNRAADELRRRGVDLRDLDQHGFDGEPGVEDEDLTEPSSRDSSDGEPEEVHGFLQRIFDIFRPLRGTAAPPWEDPQGGEQGGNVWMEDEDDQEYVSDDADLPPLEPLTDDDGHSEADSNHDLPPLRPAGNAEERDSA
ncbi:Nulp1-pending protein [Pleurostoma richardsiae]|uniref:Nulp1-pending protein n=1 Tax=Pleurostoma richardsiae TaxID=41990 RepID=A0AA38VSU6_9PEZI|nr:Nulp1-pending protein [Pleurostoma richardsiae]